KVGDGDPAVPGHVRERSPARPGAFHRLPRADGPRRRRARSLDRSGRRAAEARRAAARGGEQRARGNQGADAGAGDGGTAVGGNGVRRSHRRPGAPQARREQACAAGLRRRRAPARSGPPGGDHPSGHHHRAFRAGDRGAHRSPVRGREPAGRVPEARHEEDRVSAVLRRRVRCGDPHLGGCGALSADALIARFEEERSRALGRFGRKQAGLYYTPPTIAAEVLAIALRTSGVEDGRVLYPCAGGGAFLVRALQLVRPGGAAALLVPDTWMFLSRSGALRQEVIAQAEVAALVDLGKPFASAKDTRVQAVVLVRRPALARATYVARRGK